MKGSLITFGILLPSLAASLAVPNPNAGGNQHDARDWEDWQTTTASATSTSTSTSVYDIQTTTSTGNAEWIPLITAATCTVTETASLCAATPVSASSLNSGSWSSNGAPLPASSTSSSVSIFDYTGSGSGSGSGTGSNSGAAGTWSDSGSTYYAPGFDANNTGPNTTSISSSSNQTFIPGPTLLPAVHWEYPIDDIRNLAPINSSDIYYTSNGVADPSVQHLFASLSTTLQYDAVVLDHSSYVNSVSCSSNGIVVAFTSTESYQYACQSWSTAQEFVLVTYTEGCGASSDQRTFWLTQGLQFQDNALAIQVSIEREVAIEDAIDGVDMVWGTYYPPGSNNNTSTTGSGQNSGSGNNGGTGTGSNGSDSTGNGGNSTSGSNGSGSTGSGSTGDGGNSTSGSSTASGNSPTSGNATSNADGGSACGAPPSSTIDGFPAVACGASDFDSQLDNLIGFLDFDPNDYDSSLSDFEPDVSCDADDLDDDDEAESNEKRAIFHRRHLQKRGWFSSIVSAAKRIVSVAVKVATAPIQIAIAAVKAIPVVSNAISAATEFDPAIHGTANLALGPKDDATSPWGPAAQLYNASTQSATTTADITLYCVNCGLKGSVTLGGAAKWNLVNGLHALSTDITANLKAGLNLGLVAEATFKDTKTKSLVNQAIPDLGLSVKGIFAVSSMLVYQQDSSANRHWVKPLAYKMYSHEELSIQSFLRGPFQGCNLVVGTAQSNLNSHLNHELEASFVAPRI